MNKSVPEDKVYRLAAKMVDLSTEMLKAADDYDDVVMRDEGIALLQRSREMVRDLLEDIKMQEEEMNKKNKASA